jgi:hypothetical protein
MAKKHTRGALKKSATRNRLREKPYILRRNVMETGNF